MLDWKSFLILLFLGVLDRAMKTLAAGMCGKSQICFKGKNWQIIFFDGYMERKALRKTDSWRALLLGCPCVLSLQTNGNHLSISFSLYADN